MLWHTLWHHRSHCVYVMLWNQREGRSRWELHSKPMCFPIMVLQIRHLPEALLLQLTCPRATRLYPGRTWFPNPSWSCAPCSSYVLMGSILLRQAGIERSAVQAMCPCDSQQADVFVDLEPFAQSHYCNLSWQSAALPVIVRWPCSLLHMSYY